MTREEAILEGRRMLDRGEFKREIVQRKLIDLDFDLATLACGHTVKFFRTCEYTDFECSDCADQWIEAHAAL